MNLHLTLPLTIYKRVSGCFDSAYRRPLWRDVAHRFLILIIVMVQNGIEYTHSNQWYGQIGWEMCLDTDCSGWVLIVLSVHVFICLSLFISSESLFGMSMLHSSFHEISCTFSLFAWHGADLCVNRVCSLWHENRHRFHSSFSFRHLIYDVDSFEVLPQSCCRRLSLCQTESMWSVPPRLRARFWSF